MKLLNPHKMRVMMLGWEYPPRMAGGLGKACQGLAQAMAREGAQVYFVLPTFPERVVESRLEVVGARECMIEAGWDPAVEPVPSAEVNYTFGAGAVAGESGSISWVRSEAKLSAYGANPEGPATGTIREFISGQKAAPEHPEVKRAREGVAQGTQGTKKSTFFRTSAQAKQQPAPQHQSAPPKPEPSGKAEIYGKNLWSEIERFGHTVRQMAEGHEVDVIHAHDWMTFPAAFELQKRINVPVFLHVHATEYDRSGENLNNDVFRVEREGFRRATHIFAVSRYTAGIIERLYGVNRRKISVCYNAPEDMPGVIPTPPGGHRAPDVVFLGRLTFQKGPDHFLRAAQLVAGVDKDARFIFCGTGDLMDRLRKQAHELGIEERTHFAGFVDPAGVDEILKHSRVLVMPSVSEPFGLVALEAIRCGIPVILSKQSGVREVLQRALQVDFWDHEKLADQILASLRLPELSRQLVQDGLEQVAKLSWESSAKKVIETYQRHLGTTYTQAIRNFGGGAYGH